MLGPFQAMNANEIFWYRHQSACKYNSSQPLAFSVWTSTAAPASRPVLHGAIRTGCAMKAILCIFLSYIFFPKPNCPLHHLENIFRFRTEKYKLYFKLDPVLLTSLRGGALHNQMKLIPLLHQTHEVQAKNSLIN